MELLPAPDAALILGVGCRRGCDDAQLAALLDRVLLAHGLQGLPVVAVATIASKADEPALQGLARRLGCPLLVFSPAQLLRHTEQLSQRSERVFQATGCYGVAEGAALAMAGQMGVERPRLRVTRQASDAATLAVVMAPT
ncbi:cobalamin biosynthesis protein [Pseudomonas sp. dw_358]|uniref:cobalamin biosynthesis protein n=1 Tax=Pseudomonas sp. dw_358 TaxID=2720083 RepID=UPI001BD5D20F|nr:cobalamin biosynthesis protein [Pseudomonas sp. dw_358]